LSLLSGLIALLSLSILLRLTLLPLALLGLVLRLLPAFALLTFAPALNIRLLLFRRLLALLTAALLFALFT
jgi:hypothetical protein